MSVLLPALNSWLRLTEKPYLETTQDIPAVRRSFEQKAQLFFRPPVGSTFVKTKVADRPSVLVNPTSDADSAISVFFLHGGAYLFGSPNTHRAMVARLCTDARLQAVLPSYRLAPENPFPSALEDALAAYQAWRVKHRHVVIGGDSAGGGLALALLAEIGRLGLDPPLGAFAFSPWTDLTGSSPSLRDNAARDVILPSGRMEEIVSFYLADADSADPRASPLFADFRGAPPVWITVSDSEILLDDSLRMASHLRDHGVSAQLTVEHDLPHVWPIFQTYLPEARMTLARLAQWIRQLAGQVDGS